MFIFGSQGRLPKSGVSGLTLGVLGIRIVGVNFGFPRSAAKVEGPLADFGVPGCRPWFSSGCPGFDFSVFGFGFQARPLKSGVSGLTVGVLGFGIAGACFGAAGAAAEVVHCLILGCLGSDFKEFVLGFPAWLSSGCPGFEFSVLGFGIQARPLNAGGLWADLEVLGF